MLIHPGGTSSSFRQDLPLGIHVEEVAAEDAVTSREFINHLQHQGREFCSVFLGSDVKAITLHRAHRAHAHQLGVVALAKISSQTRKGLVEHELPIAVALQIEGCDSDQLLVAPKGQVKRLPALLGHDAARFLQGHQPIPAVEGDDVLPHQGLPLLFA